MLFAPDGSAEKVLFEMQSALDQLRVSPDGQWVVYNSDESGRYEVYVAQFPSFNDRKAVSDNGGCQPIWRKDGKELFYLTLDGTMMSVPLSTGAALQADPPRMLFRTSVPVNEVTTAICGGCQRPEVSPGGARTDRGSSGSQGAAPRGNKLAGRVEAIITWQTYVRVDQSAQKTAIWGV
jgi:hypothetical protein